MTTRLIIIVACFMTFAAGLVTGLQRQQLSTPALPDPINLNVPGPTTRGPTTRGPRPLPGFVIQQLRLSREQSEKMRKIWTDVATLGLREQQDRRNDLRKERDEAILQLVKEEAMEEYQLILQDYSEKSQSLEQELQAAYDKAVDESRQVLAGNTEQMERFDRILQNNNWDRMQWGGDRGGRGRGGPGGPGGGGRGGQGGRGGGRERDGDNNRNDGRNDNRERDGSPERMNQREDRRATSLPTVTQ